MSGSQPRAVVIRRATGADHASCLAIGRVLPQYFSPSGIEQMGRDLELHETWIAVRSETITGFAILERKSSAVIEILWLAVRPDEQGAGVGSTLIEMAVEDARRAGIVALEVKTRAETPGRGSNYAGTRRFYERHGFVLLDVIDPFPGWMPGNPCAIYIRPLTLTSISST